MEETVEVKFLHHYTDRSGDTPTAHVPGKRASFPAPKARALVTSHIAEFPSKKAAEAAAAG